jgi:hypothetical protein
MYDAFLRDNQYFVHKLDDNNVPIGDALGQHGTRVGAIAQVLTLLEGTDEKAFEQTVKIDIPWYPYEKVLKTYAAPKPTGLFSRRKAGIEVTKGSDGLRLMFIVTSNSYQDRDNETITTKALQNYVESAWTVEGKCLPRNDFLFWHKGDVVGDVVWTDMEGPFLLEVIKERKNKVVRLSPGHKTTIKQIWDVFETAPIRWGASHGFKYHESAKSADGTYEAIAKFETSILPLDAAANPYTFAGVIDEMNRDQVLDNLLKTPAAASKFRKGVRAIGDALKQQGLQHKAVDKTETKALLEDVRTLVTKIAAKFSDTPDPAAIDSAVQMLVSGMAAMTPAEVEEATADEVVDEVAVETTEVDEPEDEEKAPMAEVSAKQVRLLDTMMRSASAQAEDMSDLLGVVKAIAEAVAPVPASQKALTDAVTALDERMKMVESRFGGAPKRASQAESTVVTDDTLTKKAKEQLDKFEELFPGTGIKLKAE